MKHFTALTLTFIILITGCTAQKNVKNWTNINYAGDTMTYHKLDIYLPEISKSSYPAVIVIYGSAWFGNNLKSAAFRNYGKTLLNNGFAVVAVNHRSSRDAIFPAQINDIKAAVRFIRANARKYKIDKSFIGVTGYSSGGHLSALLGTSGSVGRYEVNKASADLEGNVGSFTGTSSSVDAVVDWFGPTAFHLMDSCANSSSHDAAGSPESTLIGGPIQDNHDKCALANPITYVDKDDPPFLILHGDADPLVPHCQSEMLYKALQDKGVKSEMVLVPGGKHGPGLFEEKYFRMMADFFIRESTK
ncbi:MAG: alpha/beta hydrolase [Bacteroidales bacterium]|nr:alpha/beta hydrolase [Bacteroidales bacterium]